MKKLSQITLAAAAAALLSVGGLAVPTMAQAQPVINVQIGQAPPPPRHEAVPAPRRGYVWSPGHWQWQRGRHVWVKGQWIKARPGHAYEAPRWVNGRNGWEYRAGHWSPHRDKGPKGRGPGHDRDGDGVPNRHDRHPGHPNRH